MNADTVMKLYAVKNYNIDKFNGDFISWGNSFNNHKSAIRVSTRKQWQIVKQGTVSTVQKKI